MWVFMQYHRSITVVSFQLCTAIDEALLSDVPERTSHTRCDPQMQMKAEGEEVKEEVEVRSSKEKVKRADDPRAGERKKEGEMSEQSL